MKLQGAFELAIDREQVWMLINDPEVLAQIIPGCKQLEQRSETELFGNIGAKVGAISSEYETTFTIIERVAPVLYRLKIAGQGKGGSVFGEMRLELEEVESGTVLRYDGEANVTGNVARAGHRLIDATAKMLANQGFKHLVRIAEGRKTLREKFKAWRNKEA